MKTITFYNEKGGVGKSTFSIMYASWLAYKHNKKVAILDLNSRAEQYRNDEIRSKTKETKVWDKYATKDPITGNWKTYKGKEMYDIISLEYKDLAYYRERGVTSMPHFTWFANNITKDRMLGQYDVIIIDFPGATSGKEFQQFAFGKNILSMINIICDRDMQTISATLQSGKVTQKFNHEPYIIMNQVQTYNKLSEFESYAKIFMNSSRFKVFPDIISYTDRIKTMDKVDIIRSTVEYPDWNNRSFTGSGDLGFENLFIDITKELDKKEDLTGTGKTDLSFVHSLEKTFQEKRQLTISSFPEYQFPKEMFPEERFAVKDEDKNKKKNNTQKTDRPAGTHKPTAKTLSEETATDKPAHKKRALAICPENQTDDNQ